MKDITFNQEKQRRLKMKKNLNEVLEQVTQEQLKDLFKNLGWESMEAILLEDGSIEYRQEGSFGDYEDEIIATMPLSITYWRDSLVEWGLYDEENDTVKTDADEEIIDDFIQENLKEAFEENEF